MNKFKVPPTSLPITVSAFRQASAPISAVLPTSPGLNLRKPCFKEEKAHAHYLLKYADDLTRSPDQPVAESSPSRPSGRCVFSTALLSVSDEPRDTDRNVNVLSVRVSCCNITRCQPDEQQILWMDVGRQQRRNKEPVG
ncbi:hypothetical protein FQA47_002370 [Oryzias melastigma]|uniref:Uncharacterized protein n=1 Tax=Oryzias melastigma TaxID=30732 RepID=A0A834FKD8_ORYME|nr:hypothetical protein FQA47_002370 [Oryzias melastigma]